MRWKDAEEISNSLEDHFSEEEIPENNLAYLEEMVISLSDFEDHDIEPSEYDLKRILEYWLDLRNS